MTEEKATELVVEAEYDMEKYTNYEFGTDTGLQGAGQRQQQQQQQQPQGGRTNKKYKAGQDCRFGADCNDPICRGIMTHKDRDGGMQKNCRFGYGCRDKRNRCKHSVGTHDSRGRTRRILQSEKEEILK